MTTQPSGRYFPEWTVADRLRKIRRESGLSINEFAEQLGVKNQRYGAWETGRNQPPVSDFVAIAKRIELAFGIAAEWTLGLDAQNPPQPDGPEGIDDVRARRDSNPKPSDPKVLPLRSRRAA